MKILNLENIRIILIHDKKACVEILSTDCLNKEQYIPLNNLQSGYLMPFIKKYGDDPICTEKEIIINECKILKTFYTYSTIKNISQIRVILLNNKYTPTKWRDMLNYIVIELRYRNALGERYYVELKMNDNSEQNKELIHQCLHEIFLRLVTQYGKEIYEPML